jgi:hypothetical protein
MQCKVEVGKCDEAKVPEAMDVYVASVRKLWPLVGLCAPGKFHFNFEWVGERRE